MLYSVGGRVGFFQGDIRLLPDDMKALQPTVFPVVPRLLNRVYDKVWNYTHTVTVGAVAKFTWPGIMFFIEGPLSIHSLVCM